MLYAAYVEIDGDGSASGWFPDVPGCYFAGESLEETLKDAHSALDAHFELMAEKGLEIPEPPGNWKIGAAPERDDVDGTALPGQWVYIDIDITRYLGKAERINISMPHLLIQRIDRAVGGDSRYSSRSHFLAEAARKELSQI